MGVRAEFFWRISASGWRKRRRRNRGAKLYPRCGNSSSRNYYPAERNSYSPGGDCNTPRWYRDAAGWNSNTFWIHRDAPRGPAYSGNNSKLDHAACRDHKSSGNHESAESGNYATKRHHQPQ